MRDVFTPPQPMYFSSRDLSPLRESSNEITKRIAEVVNQSFVELEAELSKYDLQKNGGQNLCEIASVFLDARLKAAGLPARILAGDVVVAPHQSLEHHVNWIQAPEEWVIVDSTADQIPKQNGKRMFVRIVEPNIEALKKMLQEEYGWWFPKE